MKKSHTFNFKAFIVAVCGTFFIAFTSGAFVGLFFLQSFWTCTICISVPALYFIWDDAVPARFYEGTIRGYSLGRLFWYALTSTEKQISSTSFYDSNGWQKWFLYNSDHHKR